MRIEFENIILRDIISRTARAPHFVFTMPKPGVMYGNTRIHASENRRRSVRDMIRLDRNP